MTTQQVRTANTLAAKLGYYMTYNPAGLQFRVMKNDRIVYAAQDMDSILNWLGAK